MACVGVAEQKPNGNLATDIPGLRSRISNPLELLGLYGTSHEACHRHHIPALRVTGDATEEQILSAGKVKNIQFVLFFLHKRNFHIHHFFNSYTGLY